MSTVTKENPFRVGTKLYRIFEYMKDGEYHTLWSITTIAYGSTMTQLYSAGMSYLGCRRVASALRTIRATPGWGMLRSHILHSRPGTDHYRMVREEVVRALRRRR